MTKTYGEQMIQAINDGVYVEDRFPVFTKNVKTYISFQVDVWVVNLQISLFVSDTSKYCTEIRCYEGEAK